MLCFAILLLPLFWTTYWIKALSLDPPSLHTQGAQSSQPPHPTGHAQPNWITNNWMDKSWIQEQLADKRWSLDEWLPDKWTPESWVPKSWIPERRLIEDWIPESWTAVTATSPFGSSTGRFLPPDVIHDLERLQKE
jgi:hypothetical protein